MIPWRPQAAVASSVRVATCIWHVPPAMSPEKMTSFQIWWKPRVLFEVFCEYVSGVRIPSDLPYLDRARPHLLLHPQRGSPSPATFPNPDLVDSCAGVGPDADQGLQSEIPHDGLVSKACPSGLDQPIESGFTRRQCDRRLHGAPRSDHMLANHHAATAHGSAFPRAARLVGVTAHVDP